MVTTRSTAARVGGGRARPGKKKQNATTESTEKDTETKGVSNGVKKKKTGRKSPPPKGSSAGKKKGGKIIPPQKAGPYLPEKADSSDGPNTINSVKTEFERRLEQAAQRKTPKYIPDQELGDGAMQITWDGTIDLDYATVVSAIGTVWAALYTAGELKYAFNTARNFRSLMENANDKFKELEIKYAGSSRTYMIPILLTENDVDQEYDDSTGIKPSTIKKAEAPQPQGRGKRDIHIMLACVTKVAKPYTESGRLWTTYIDSLPDHMAHTVVRHKVRSSIRASQWACLSEHQLELLPSAAEIEAYKATQWIKWTWETWHLAALHSPDIKASGIHTIINAWILLLGLDPVTYDEHRELAHEDYGRAIRVINMVLEGRADLGLIRSFLQHDEYAEVVPNGSSYEHDDVITYFMSESSLEDFVVLAANYTKN